MSSLEIHDIIDAIQNSRIRITDHADEEAENDDLTFEEIYYSVFHAFMVKSSRIIPATNRIRVA